MVVMMDMEISCKGHCEKSSHFLDHVSHTVFQIFFFFCPTNADGMANNVDPDQTAPTSSLIWVCAFCSNLSVQIC